MHCYGFPCEFSLTADAAGEIFILREIIAAVVQTRKRIIIWSIMSICITVAVCIHSCSALNNFAALLHEAPWKHYKWDFWLNVTAAAKCCCIIFCIIHEWEAIMQQRCCEVIWDYELSEIIATHIPLYTVYNTRNGKSLWQWRWWLWGKLISFIFSFLSFLSHIKNKFVCDWKIISWYENK